LTECEADDYIRRVAAPKGKEGGGERKVLLFNDAYGFVFKKVLIDELFLHLPFLYCSLHLSMIVFSLF